MIEVPFYRLRECNSRESGVAREDSIAIAGGEHSRGSWNIECET